MKRLTIHVVALFANRAGGADVYTADLTRELVRRGHEVTLVCHEAAVDLQSACRVCRVPRMMFDVVPFAWRFGAALQMVNYRRELCRVSLSDPDIVIGSGQQLTWAHRRRFSRVPLIYVPHAMVAPEFVSSGEWVSTVQRHVATSVSRHIERRLINEASRVVRFTSTGCVALRRYYGKAARPHFSVFPAPVHVPPPPDFERVASGTLNLLFVGRLVKTKNVSLLINALARPQLRDLPWHLDIVGDGVERDRLQAMTRTAQLAERVVFHGQREDICRYYRASDLLLFPSRLESLGLVVLEAMSHGVPALTIRANGSDYRNANHEVITDGHDGFIAESEEAFIARLTALLRDREALSRVGRQARLTVEQKHTWREHVDRYEALMASVLGANHERRAVAPLH